VNHCHGYVIIEFDKIKSLCTKNEPEQRRPGRVIDIDRLSILQSIFYIITVKEIYSTVNNTVHLLVFWILN